MEMRKFLSNSDFVSVVLDWLVCSLFQSLVLVWVMNYSKIYTIIQMKVFLKCRIIHILCHFFSGGLRFEGNVLSVVL